MSILRPKRVGWETVNKASNGEQLFRRFFVAKKTATKKTTTKLPRSGGVVRH